MYQKHNKTSFPRSKFGIANLRNFVKKMLCSLKNNLKKHLWNISVALVLLLLLFLFAINHKSEAKKLIAEEKKLIGIGDDFSLIEYSEQKTLKQGGRIYNIRGKIKFHKDVYLLISKDDKFTSFSPLLIVKKFSDTVDFRVKIQKGETQTNVVHIDSNHEILSRQAIEKMEQKGIVIIDNKISPASSEKIKAKIQKKTASKYEEAVLQFSIFEKEYNAACEINFATLNSDKQSLFLSDLEKKITNQKQYLSLLEEFYQELSFSHLPQLNDISSFSAEFKQLKKNINLIIGKYKILANATSTLCKKYSDIHLRERFDKIIKKTASKHEEAALQFSIFEKEYNAACEMNFAALNSDKQYLFLSDLEKKITNQKQYLSLLEEFYQELSFSHLPQLNDISSFSAEFKQLKKNINLIIGKYKILANATSTLCKKYSDIHLRGRFDKIIKKMPLKFELPPIVVNIRNFPIIRGNALALRIDRVRVNSNKPSGQLLNALEQTFPTPFTRLPRRLINTIGDLTETYKVYKVPYRENIASYFYRRYARYTSPLMRNIILNSELGKYIVPQNNAPIPNLYQQIFTPFASTKTISQRLDRLEKNIMNYNTPRFTVSIDLVSYEEEHVLKSQDKNNINFEIHSFLGTDVSIYDKTQAKEKKFFHTITTRTPGHYTFSRHNKKTHFRWDRTDVFKVSAKKLVTLLHDDIKTMQ